MKKLIKLFRIREMLMQVVTRFCVLSFFMRKRVVEREYFELMAGHGFEKYIRAFSFHRFFSLLACV